MHELSDLVPEPGARAAAIELLHARTAIYTAEPVVDDLLDRLDWPTGLRRIVDPSCGDGMFVARALERLLRLHAPDDSTLMRLVQGWEVHPGACEDARARVAQILMSAGRSVGRARRIARVMIVNRDFLSEGPSVGTADLVVANPPYIRKVRVPALLRREYEKYVPDYASHDLLHSFLERCARLLKPGGKIGMVTADRWLFNSGARRLREELGRRVSIRHLARLDAATAFHRPKRRLAGAPPRVHPVAVVLGCVLDGSGRSMTGDAVFPGVDMGRYAGVRTLGEIAQVRIAPWLGTPGIFVIDVATAARLPSSCLVPAVDTDDIVDGVLRHPVRFAIRTAPGQEPPAAILAHLEANRHRMAGRMRLASA
jgi:SAM-dependent methyltransferase